MSIWIYILIILGIVAIVFLLSLAIVSKRAEKKDQELFIKYLQEKYKKEKDK